VEASLRFYLERLGFPSPWPFDEEGKGCVADVDRQGYALILADTQFLTGIVAEPSGRKGWQGADGHFAER